MKGLVIVVAGAGGPAGRAVTRRLAEAGATVVAADADKERLDAALSAAPEGVEGEVIDLLDLDAVRGWAGRVEERHGRVDGVIHLVGGWRGASSFAETDLGDWALLHDLLVRTLQHTTLAFEGAIKRSENSRFAIVSAQAAAKPTENNACYATAKVAAETWMLAFADALRGTESAAVTLVVKALVDDAMRAAKPEAKFLGFTDVADLAEAVAGLWKKPAADLNGARVDLTT
ncbi:SDR family NAD(P)-dependent oxidoreductase [Bailinhaonella thermotolerans]|uniref:SDR family oxidoreductase n=1 Tax=Bailinhaonella thermotolerans TaxID=1070861 RepID=A0A3A4AID5_9ACTN|nr:SDR family oxidoreductase [Bailinhaonella thermotolerans]RJL20527.1 SDR family oxidoreductase [Bailinhaonella thermotolerans]